jgi:hypothetical protein
MQSGRGCHCESRDAFLRKYSLDSLARSHRRSASLRHAIVREHLGASRLPLRPLGPNVSQTNTYLATTLQRQRAAIEKRDLARTNLAQTETPPVEAAQITR